MTKNQRDALIERINALADVSYWANAGWDIPGDATQVIGRLAVKAAAALRELVADRDSWEQQASDRIDDVLEQADRAERAEAERDALRADAERYRFLRQYSSTDFYGAVQDATGRFPDSDEDADAAIDAAIAQEKP